MAYSLNDVWNGSVAFVTPTGISITDGILTAQGTSGQGPRCGWRIATVPGDRVTFYCEAKATSGTGHLFATYNSTTSSLVKDCKITSPIWQIYKIDMVIAPTRGAGEVYIQCGLYGGDAQNSNIQFRNPVIIKNGGQVINGVARDGLRFNSSGQIELVVGENVSQRWTSNQNANNFISSAGIITRNTSVLQQSFTNPTVRAKTFAIDDFLSGLKSDGVLDKLKSLHLGLIPELIGFSVNLATPTINDLTTSGTITFTPWLGPGENGIPAYFIVPYSPATSSIFGLTDHSMGVIVNPTEDRNGYSMGTSTHAIGPRSTTGAGRFYVRNGSTTSDFVEGPLAEGLFSMNRNNQNNFDMLHNGVVLATKTRDAGTPSSTNFNILRLAGLTDYPGWPVQLAFIGSSLSTSEHLAIWTRFQTLKTALG